MTAPSDIQISGCILSPFRRGLSFGVRLVAAFRIHPRHQLAYGRAGRTPKGSAGQSCSFVESGIHNLVDMEGEVAVRARMRLFLLHGQGSDSGYLKGTLDPIS